MPDPNDPTSAPPEERLTEVGRILAAGYLRHRTTRAGAAASPGPLGLGRSPENDLDRPGDQSVHVPHAEGS